MVVPTFPKLLLQINDYDAVSASFQYGFITSLKYFLEFLFSPVLGAVSDSIGRKRVLLFSLTTVVTELSLIALFPTISTVLLATVIRGCGDQTQTMLYAMGSDIATHNEEPVTRPFGYLGGVFGLGCIIGPMCGSIIANTSLPLCFAVSAAISTLALVVTIALVKESLLTSIPFTRTRVNPLSNLRFFFTNSDLSSLSIPFLLSHLCTGIYFIWILYMTQEFRANVMEVGMFLSIAGCVLGIWQGLLLPFLVPTYLSDESAVMVGLVISCLQMASYGSAPSLKMFYIIMLLFSPSSIYGPPLKSLFAKSANPDQQGSLQGALSSLRTLTAACGSLLFTAVYSKVTELDYCKGSPFFLAGALYLISAAFTLRYFADKRHRDSDPVDGYSSGGIGSTGINSIVLNEIPVNGSLDKSKVQPLSQWWGGQRTPSGDEENLALLPVRAAREIMNGSSSTSGLGGSGSGGSNSSRNRYASGSLSRSGSGVAAPVRPL